MKDNDEIYIRQLNKTQSEKVKNMQKLSSFSPAIENALIKLTFRQKQLIYQIARLDFRVYTTLARLDKLNGLIDEENKSISSLNSAIQAAGKGKVADKLNIWKEKAEYKLFRLNLRKSKIDLVKLLIDQSKLEQLKQALISLGRTLEEIKKQNQVAEKPIAFVPLRPGANGLYEFYIKEKGLTHDNPLQQSIRDYLKNHLKMAS